jgi:hypothetical protein
MTAQHVTPCKGADLPICVNCQRLQAHAERPSAVPMRPQTGTRGRCIDYVASKPGAEV